tara:strand:+ start:116 stop:289 length:174 start_codon:yes stop_codon:yes gene_type:complete
MINTVTQNYFMGNKAGYIVTYKDSNITKVVPEAADNTDYQEILEWVAAGNTITDPGE